MEDCWACKDPEDPAQFIICADCDVPHFMLPLDFVDKLFDAIKHGDAAHQAWLKAKIKETFPDPDSRP